MKNVNVLGVMCAALLSGCAGQISGEVDKEGVPAFGQAFSWGVQIPFFNFHHAVAMLVTYGDACRVTTELDDERRDARQDFDQAMNVAGNDEAKQSAARSDYAERMDENDRALLPADYWTATIEVNAEDDDDVEGEEFSFDPAPLPEAALTLCHQKDYPDYDEVAAGENDDNRDCWVANDGSVEILVYDGDLMQGQGDAELVEQRDLNDNAGDIELSFGAEHCEDYEDLVD